MAQAQDGPLFGPAKEYRSLGTDVYVFRVQKNGRTDVQTAAGAPVFDNAHPLVLFAGDDKPTPLAVDGRYSARDRVHGPLGEGQALVLARKNCEWRLHAYPAQPFFTVQVVFINNSRKPVRVARLIPWAVDAERGGALHVGAGADQARILEDGRILSQFNDFAQVVTGNSQGQWNVALWNPQSGRTLVAGFLTHAHGYTQLRLERDNKSENTLFNRFSAECVYDPPVEVAPGAAFASELLYIAVGERSPHEGLERYGEMLATLHGKPRQPAFIPHGWDSWSTRLGSGISEEALLADLDAMDRELKRYGWTHFAIDAGWARARGDWEPNERFPRGMAWLASEIQRRGMTSSLWVSPLLADKDSQLAREHPEWMAPPSRKGRLIVGDNTWIVDITAPGAYAYVRDLCRKITHEWGYDGIVEADFAYYELLAERYTDPSVTGVAALRMGMEAIREGMGPDKFLMGTIPHHVTGPLSDGVRTGMDCAPVWESRRLAGPWGCVETLTQSARRYYYRPFFVPDQDCVFFGHDVTRARWNVEDRPRLTRDQQIAWLTGAALTGGAVKIGDRFSELAPDEIGMLRRILPVPPRAARPIDLFKESPPSVWALPVKAAAGEWLVAAVFNWDAANTRAFTLDFRALGLDPSAHYTVYEFWGETYHGIARGQVNVQLPPGSARVYGLRRHANHPQFLSTNRHFTMGATDHTLLEWDAAAGELRGRFAAVADTHYVLRVLVPPSFTFTEAAVDAGESATRMDGDVLSLSFYCEEGGAAAWSLRFAAAPDT